MQDSQNRSNNQGGSGSSNRRRRYRGNRSSGGGGQPGGNPPQEGQSRNTPAPRPASAGPKPASAENRNRSHQASARPRRGNGRVLTTNQVLVKYDNLLEQHLITRRKYYEYFNRVDDRQLYKLEKNFFDSIEHLRRFEANLEPWQREALEKRKTERYRLDLTYSGNHGLDPLEAKVEVTPEEIEDPHFKESQKEAFQEYKEDTEESVGTFEDYLKLKGQA
ncbi:MAG: hypothetical protein NDI69_07270 [Bacteriovoracaceae bacterium]|nr:hypothetical protein [Bacteriovoracaceae bacterium]